MALRELRNGARLAVGAAALGAMLVSSSSVAGEDKDSSKKGGALVCYGQRGVNTGRGTASTHLDLMNNNEQSTIQIDRILVYKSDGSLVCEIRPARPLGPHVIFHLFTEGAPCPNWQPATAPGAYGVTFVVYWSFSECHWPWNELSGVSQVSVVETNGQSSEFLNDCKPIDARL